MVSIRDNKNGPAARVGGRVGGRVAVGGWQKGFSREDREILEGLMGEVQEYMEDEAFGGRDAEERIFDPADDVPEPDATWYLSFLNDDPDKRERDVASQPMAVLKAKQERVLFLRLNYARFRMAKIQEQAQRGELSGEEATELLKWYRVAEGVHDQITRYNLGLVIAMARRFRSSSVDFTEQISEGNMALLRAIDKFRADRGFKFSTYACRAIIKALGRAGKKQTKHNRLFMLEDERLPDRSDYRDVRADSQEIGCRDEVVRIFRENRARLSDLERDVIRHRFGIDVADAQEAAGEGGEETGGAPTEQLTLEQVGRLVGLTKERVRQIQVNALKRLRKSLEETYLDGSKRLPASRRERRRKKMLEAGLPTD